MIKKNQCHYTPIYDSCEVVELEFTSGLYSKVLKVLYLHTPVSDRLVSREALIAPRLISFMGLQPAYSLAYCRPYVIHNGTSMHDLLIMFHELESQLEISLEFPDCTLIHTNLLVFCPFFLHNYIIFISFLFFDLNKHCPNN